MGGCSQLASLQMKPVHEPKLDIYHLCNLGATNPNHVLFVEPYLHVIPN
jgi:hypothetical protein